MAREPTDITQSIPRGPEQGEEGWRMGPRGTNSSCPQHTLPNRISLSETFPKLLLRPHGKGEKHSVKPASVVPTSGADHRPQLIITADTDSESLSALRLTRFISNKLPGDGSHHLFQLSPPHLGGNNLVGLLDLSRLWDLSP